MINPISPQVVGFQPGMNPGTQNNISAMSQDEIARFRAKKVFFVTDGVKYGSFDKLKNYYKGFYDGLVHKLTIKDVEANNAALKAMEQMKELEYSEESRMVALQKIKTSNRIARALEKLTNEGADTYSTRVAERVVQVKAKQLVAVAKKVLELSAKRASKV